MTRWKKSLTIATCLLLLVLGEGAAPAIAQTARIQSITGNGKVTIQRQNRTNWDLASPGKEFKEGDQILPDSGMKVLVRCPNQTDPVRVKAGVVSGIGSICIDWVARNERGSHLDLATLGGFDPTIPYLITPRHTLLLTQKPSLRRNAVPGTIEYAIEVKSPNRTLWQTKTKNNETLYAGLALEAGIPYTVVIRTNGGKSSLDEMTPDGKSKSTHLEFRVLRPSETLKIANTNPSEIADILALVERYNSYVLQESLLASYQFPRDYAETYNLTGEAIALLESVIERGQSSPLIHRTLGDLYWQTGLIHPAQAAYKKAIALAKTPENLEDVTIAQEQLGQIYGLIGNKDEARQAYLQAKEGYKSLGDKSKVEEIQTQLDRLKS
jgi:Tetratricopeptide repeat